MGNQPDKIAWGEEEFNAHNKYLYDLEDDPEYQSTVWVDNKGYELNNKNRESALNWMCDIRSGTNLKLVELVLAVYVMDAYCSIVNVSRKDIGPVLGSCLFLARNCTNIDTIEIDDLWDDDYLQTNTIMSDIIQQLGGRIIRPTPSFYIHNVTDLQNALIFLALVDENMIIYKPSLIAETVRYMTSDENLEENLSEDTKAICYSISSTIEKLKNSTLERLKILAFDVFSNENLKKKCVSAMNFKSRESAGTIKNLPIFRTPYKKLDVLGSGISGEVHKINRRGKDLAVKLQDQAYYEEVSILALLSKSKYIIKLEGFLPENIDKSFLFFEIGNYDLKSAIVKYDYPNKSEKELLMYFKQILEGLAACEYYDVIHADIKPDNVLWFEKEKRYKLIDFGLAMSMSSQRDELRVEVCTAMFRPPEVFLSNGNYDYKIDIWSVGCVLYHMVTGRYYVDYTKLLRQSDMFKFVFRDQGIPTEETWPGVTKLPNYEDYEDLSFPRNPNFLREIPDNKNMCYAVIKSCLTMNPKNRPNAETLLGCLKKY